MNTQQNTVGTINQEHIAPYLKTFESREVSVTGAGVIEQIKTHAAALLALYADIQVAPGNTEGGRLVSLAKTELESSVMWATKAVSRIQ